MTGEEIRQDKKHKTYNSMNLPNHIVIIPDGNRRWAREKNLKPWEGHEEGAKNIEALVRKALDLKIKNISFWGSSLGNLEKRPLLEKKALLDIYDRYFAKLIDSDEVRENEARINIIGRWKQYFPASLIKTLEGGIEKTKNYKNYNLNFFLAYDGDDDMLEAVKNIAKKEYRAGDINGEIIKENLMTRDLPAVDYMIRTGGEPHLSAGFLMWDTADAQLYFSEKYFPDFGVKEFEEALAEYQRRERRKGV
ncbi:MAG: Isoprenyl transferase [Parcubacteria group bacterium Athens0714_25]|nr:MAG: Isoprenyl transferase [Parcubacteria group bacterium Athens0714_25]